MDPYILLERPIVTSTLVKMAIVGILYGGIVTPLVYYLKNRSPWGGILNGMVAGNLASWAFLIVARALVFELDFSGSVVFLIGHQVWRLLYVGVLWKLVAPGAMVETAAQTAASGVEVKIERGPLPLVQRRALLQKQIRRVVVHILALLIAIWILMPIWLAGTMAFSTPDDVRGYPKHFAPSPVVDDTMDAFLLAEGTLDAAQNSIIVAVSTLVLSTLIAAPAGYAISRYLFPGRDAFRLSILAVRAFPIVILAVPLAETFRDWNMYDKVYSLALMHTALTLPTTILVISSVFASVPRELEEAARVFGCNPNQAFWRIVFPLALPGIAASAIFTFVMSWNEVFAAVLLTLENRTLPAKILYTLDKSGQPFQFAGGFFMLIPALYFIFFVRRYLFNMWGQVTK